MVTRVVLLLITVFGSSVGLVHGQLRTEFLMNSDPTIEVPPAVKVFSSRYLPLWKAALASREQDMQRRTADTVSRAAGMGMTGLIELVPQFEVVLAAEDSLPAVRYAAARALIAIESKGSATTLWDVAQRQGLDLRQLIEPVLAQWNFSPGHKIWMARLNDSSVRHRDLMLAVKCLGQVREVAALPRLGEFVQDTSRPADLRLEAAATAANLTQDGLEADAIKLSNDKRGSSSIISRVCAVRLLSRHTSPMARTQLVAAAKDSEPAVAAAAMSRLLEIDPDLMLPLAESALVSADPKIRQAGVDTYINRPTPERMSAIAKLLDDVHPAVRSSVREALFRLAATPDLNDVIRNSAMKELASQSWRGQEQAALLLGALDHEPAAGRLIELMEAKRPEVMITAAWALRQLAVAETLPAMLDKATRQTKLRLESAWPMELDQQVAHLMEAFGQMKYREADALLRQHVPKDLKLGDLSRSAAVWSLGKLNEGVLDDALAKQLIERAADVASIPSEMELVRHMSAITLARMGAVNYAKRLREIMGPGNTWSRAGIAMRWAVIQLTGEKIPEPEAPATGLGFSFLEPQ